MNKNRNSHLNGFTLIELLVYMVILGVLGTGLLSLQYILGQNQTLVLKTFTDVDEANTNVALLVKELRIARTSDNGTYALDTVNDHEIIFYSDYDFDGDTEKIRYYLDGYSFYKGTIEPTEYPISYPQESERVKLLTNNVRNIDTPVFYYYNNDWPNDVINNPLSQDERLSQTKTIRIYLRLNEKAFDPEKDYVLESYVQLRMLKDN